MVGNVTHLPEALALLRDIRGASMEDVAAATGVARSTVHRIETRKTDIGSVRMDTINALCAWLDGGR